jgi:electron transfer flavoprotein beta subunit
MMKIAVLIKSVPDTATLLRVGEDRKSVVIDHIKPVMNPYDEYALEEAVRLKEAVGGEVIAISMGDENSRKILRTALAAGADSALLINRPSADAMTSRTVAKILAAALVPISADIIFAGKQAIDDDASQVPERVAEILDLAHASCITRFACKDGKAEVDREIEGGNCTMELPLPALLTVTKGINIPRYPTLPNILKAKQKVIKETTPEELGFSSACDGLDLVVESMSQPRQKRLLTILAGDVRTQTRQLAAMINKHPIAFTTGKTT